VIEVAEQIGFVGLGIMGQGMARNLLSAGFEVVVWNRTAGKVPPLVEQGARAAGSPRELAEQCEIVVICVSDTPDVQAVLFDEQGVASGLRPNSLVIDCSTISPAATRQFAARLALQGAEWVDAPVSGGSEGAAAGTLSIMVGGSESAFARARPVLQGMGKTITHVGPVGAGQTVKLVNQILVVGSMVSMAEALVFAQAGGVDLQKALAAVSGGAAGSWTLTNRGPQVIARDWRPGFTVDLQQKDLRLVLQAADELCVPLQVCSMAFHYYRTVQKRGGGGEGNHAIVKALEALAGVEVGAPE
jgi:3-hydroxyisobutyrate dehydrogenase-like beta-hydroxyacid dehydrogenase